VAADGTAAQPVLAPRLKLADVQGHALMVHAGGDNHSDHPAAGRWRRPRGLRRHPG
jgi:Cu-Zn family superoxide dismutase